MRTAHLTSGPDLPIGKILCIGRNYTDHIKELGNATPEAPVIFIKPASSVIGEGERIVIPSYSSDCHHEVELALLIGRKGKDIPVDRAMESIAGYGVGIDLTLRDVQSELKKKGLPWEIAKGLTPPARFPPSWRLRRGGPRTADPHVGERRGTPGWKHLDDDPPDPRHHQLHVGPLHARNRRRHPHGDPCRRRPHRLGDHLAAEIPGVATLRVPWRDPGAAVSP